MIEDELNSLWKRVERGDWPALKGEITALAGRRLTREQKLRLATIANDAFLSPVAHRLLYRYAGVAGKLSKATGGEKLEYGRALTHMDLLTEALEVLKAVPSETHPMVYLALGLLYSRQWDYASMVPVLRAGVAHHRVVGRRALEHKVLLANALFTANGERAEPDRLLKAVVQEAHAQGYWEVETQAVQIILAHHLWDHEWEQARHWLEVYEGLFRDQPAGRQALTREKWWRVLELHTSSDKEGAIQKMEDLKIRFAQAGLFSQVRNCEYYQAMCFGDRGLAARLYYGSPFPCFKQRVVRDCKVPEPELPSFQDFEVGPRGPAGGGEPEVLDATRGTSSRTSDRLKTGQAPHRLLLALIADYYVPASVYELCARVYPDEFFNPMASPLRISQLLLRLREWLASNRSGLRIEEIDGRYHLKAAAPLVIRVHAPWATRSAEDELGAEARRLLDLLRERFGPEPFAAGDLERLAGVSRSTALNTLRALVEAGMAGKSGAGAGTRYRLVSAANGPEGKSRG